MVRLRRKSLIFFWFPSLTNSHNVHVRKTAGLSIVYYGSAHIHCKYAMTYQNWFWTETMRENCLASFRLRIDAGMLCHVYRAIICRNRNGTGTTLVASVSYHMLACWNVLNNNHRDITIGFIQYLTHVTLVCSGIATAKGLSQNLNHSTTVSFTLGDRIVNNRTELSQHHACRCSSSHDSYLLGTYNLFP